MATGHNVIPNGDNENGDEVAPGNENGRNTETPGEALINAAVDGERVKVFGAMIKQNTTTISADESARKLMLRDNEPNPHCWKDGQFTAPEGTLSEDKWLEAGEDYAEYMKPKVRMYRQVASLSTILRCKYRWGAVRYSPDSNFKNEHIAIYRYGQSKLSALKNDRNEFINYNEASALTYAYYRPIAGIENVSAKEAEDSSLLDKASTRLRTLKLKMLALIIRRMAKGFKLNKSAKGRGGPQNKLSWYKEDDAAFYNLHVLPLAQSAIYMMDNERKINLSVQKIVNVNVDSFSRECVRLMELYGIWSVDFLRTKQHDDMNEVKKAEYSFGLEFTVARVFCMLTEGAALPEYCKWHITDEEKTVVFGRDLIIVSEENGYPNLVPLV